MNGTYEYKVDSFNFAFETEPYRRSTISQLRAFQKTRDYTVLGALSEGTQEEIGRI
jgi:hypothetical protein